MEPAPAPVEPPPASVSPEEIPLRPTIAGPAFGEDTKATGGAAAPLTGDALDTAVAALATSLGETDERAVNELREVVVAYGLDLARAAEAKTQEIEAAGGMVREGKRKSPGGVFFFLVKRKAGRAMLGPEFADLRPARAAVPPPAPPPSLEQTPAPPAATSRPAPGRNAGDLLAAMVGFIAKNPGLREDEIRARLGGDRLLVRATPDALRTQRRVRTMGSGRAMTYSVPD